ncbi:MAG: DNA polymerase-3 subunit gamma/tau [Candidatus Azotimanducaceae bacterium]
MIAMATQSLYRRYRPRRFSEVRGQDHVVKALRNSVAEGREGQAYLFSGPRGTGKTTSARILAKVLNCTNVQEGEPCCECESCLSVERGTSYDVHELDAASNNGVDAMRDLIDKASLGTPGRHKVYILDEVHMLTKPAEAALLKTLEEPPPHVVFVLATTDPQKMSDTIRSRTQHLQFHLLPADTLEQHVRWVAEDAGLVVSDTAIEQVLAQGGGSARDTLSALELVANTGGEGAETVPLGEFVESMIERDAGRALTMAAGAIGLGRDPRRLTEELIGYLRNGFLSIMAPDLVQLPSLNVSTLSDQAQRLGAAGLVRGIEQLGEALTEMRNAPDPRVLLDVAIVKLTSDAAASGDAGAALGALTARVAKLEKQIAAGAPVVPASAAPNAAAPVATTTAAPADAASPTDPKTGRAQLGGRARRSAAPAPERPASEPAVPEPAVVANEPARAAQSVELEPALAPTPATPIPDPAAAPEPAAPEPAAPAPAAPVAPAAPEGGVMHRAVWDEDVKPGLRGMARAVFSPAVYVSNTESRLTLSLPNPIHREKCEQHRDAVEKVLAAAAGAPVALELVIVGGDDGGSREPFPGGAPAPASAPSQQQQGAAPAVSSDSSVQSADSGVGATVVALPPTESPRKAAERRLAEAAAAGVSPFPEDDVNYEPSVTNFESFPADDEIDLHDLVDAPPETVKTPIDRLAEAFPGSELVDDNY